MKKLFILFSLFILIGYAQCFALIVTDNVDRNDFGYQIPYVFATEDLSASLTAAIIPVRPRFGSRTNENFFHTVLRNGNIVGIVVTGSNPISEGAATFDVTINGTVTGIQTVIEAKTPIRTAKGESGKSGSQFSYMEQNRDDVRAAQGFRVDTDRASFHDSNHPFGRATPLSAGDRVGVKVTTSSGFSPTQIDYIVTVYVLD